MYLQNSMNNENIVKNKPNKNRALSCISSSTAMDWKILVNTFFVVNVLLIIFALYTNFLIKDDKVSYSSENIKVDKEIINQKELNNVVNFFGAKQEKFEKLNIQKPKNIDPSL
ncbi:MAG: hypothetical protein IT215_06465 [Chitinophagaceae bacterium]|nr:hypothetical protein [Chitinophagaceae bacterium]